MQSPRLQRGANACFFRCYMLDLTKAACAFPLGRGAETEMGKTRKIVICDDEQALAARLADRIHESRKDSEITLCASAAELEHKLQEGFDPDVAVMDIRLGDGSGIEAVKKLFHGRSTQVIYITSYVEYCTDVYETEHVYFLKKPVDGAMLELALQKAEKKLAGTHKKLCFSRGGGTVCFRPEEILFFESSYRKLYVHTDSGTEELYAIIDNVMEEAGGRFIQCHKSFLVNLDRVSSMEHKFFVMDNGEHVPISRGRAEETRKKFFESLGE